MGGEKRQINTERTEGGRRYTEKRSEDFWWKRKNGEWVGEVSRSRPLFLCFCVSAFLCFSVFLSLCLSVSLCLCVSVPLCRCVSVSLCSRLWGWRGLWVSSLNGRGFRGCMGTMVGVRDLTTPAIRCRPVARCGSLAGTAMVSVGDTLSHTRVDALCFAHWATYAGSARVQPSVIHLAPYLRDEP